MVRYALPLLLAALIAGTGLAAPGPFTGPGEALVSASSWEGEAFLPLGPGRAGSYGLGARGSLGIEGLPLKGAFLDLDFGYRWIQGRWGSPLPMPGAGIAAGYRFSGLGPFFVSPALGLDLDIPMENGAARFSLGAKVGARAGMRLSGRDYLSASATLAIPFEPAEPTRIGLSLGMRSERAWLIPGKTPAPDSGPSPAPSASPAVVAPSPVAGSSPEPAILLAVNPALLSPDEDWVDDILFIRAETAWKTPIASWTLRIDDPSGKPFYSRRGQGRLPAELPWYGLSDKGALPEPAMDYSIVMTALDSKGRAIEGRASVTIDILVIKDGDRYKIRVPDIIFSPNSFALSDAAFLEENRAVLTRIATIFKRFPGYGLTVEGHTNSDYWRNEEDFKREQRVELAPLSQARADSVRKALIAVGIDGSRIKALGVGGLKPIYPFSDAENAWRNRRVEFILAK